jgi:hypothetical protein
MAFTFNSSVITAQKDSAGISALFRKAAIISAKGWRVFTLAALRTLRAKVTISNTAAMSFSKAVSINFSSGLG